MSSKAFRAVEAGIKDAIAYLDGDKTKGVATIVEVPNLAARNASIAGPFRRFPRDQPLDAVTDEPSATRAGVKGRASASCPYSLAGHDPIKEATALPRSSAVASEVGPVEGDPE